MTPFQLRRTVDCLHAGGVIAYPTEAVYGLGCDPLDTLAVSRILTLKHRSVSKGLILIASSVEQLANYVDINAIPKQVLQSWPGPYTWILPVLPGTPNWLTGDHTSLAVRVTAHPVAAMLCAANAGPLVSTSANPEGQPPARTDYQARAYFADKVDYYVAGLVDPRANPTEIRVAATGQLLRQA